MAKGKRNEDQGSPVAGTWEGDGDTTLLPKLLTQARFLFRRILILARKAEPRRWRRGAGPAVPDTG